MEEEEESREDKKEKVPVIDSTQSTICTFNTVRGGAVLAAVKVVVRDGSKAAQKSSTATLLFRLRGVAGGDTMKPTQASSAFTYFSLSLLSFPVKISTSSRFTEEKPSSKIQLKRRTGLCFAASVVCWAFLVEALFTVSIRVKKAPDSDESGARSIKRKV